jgi:hypothetical protein
MSARSFARNTVLLLATAAACGGKKKPEADPAKAQALAKIMATASVPFAGLRTCAAADFQKTMMTQLTLLRLAKEEVPDAHERKPWINPSEIDSPSARVLVDGTDETLRRQAAAEFLASGQYLVNRVDLVDVPLALGFKELKRGAVGIRAIGYDRNGDPLCVTPYTVQNDKKISEEAMQKSDKAVVDPAIAQMLRDDLKVQLLAKLEQLRTAP